MINMTKNKLPTINIKGKEYVMVKDRVLAFNEFYKNGSIETEIVSAPESATIIVKAIVVPDIASPTRRFVDYSQAKIGQGLINTTSALENASTSAVGRALAYMGIGVIESIASADEIVKAEKSIEYEKDKVCPKDKGRLVISFTSAGKKFLKCENAKWDAEQHKNIGCDYVDWLNPIINHDKKEPYKGKTISVEDYENLGPGEEVNL
jgi:hypothetical protein